MNLIIIGPSGSGKGTQAELLSKKFNIPTISMGELIRQASEQKIPEGIKAENYWRKGNWVPAELTFRILQPALNQGKKGFVLDGFPRTIEQVPLLEKYLEERGKKIDKVIHLWISDEEAVKRLLLRAKKDIRRRGKPRKDETEEIIRERLSSYHQTVDPILDYYRKKGILEKVDGERPIEPIHQDIMKRLKR